MATIFISHVAADARVADELTGQLTATGWQVTRPVGVSLLAPSGEREATLAVAAAADAFVLVISPFALNERDFETLVEAARASNRPTVYLLNSVTDWEIRLRRPTWVEESPTARLVNLHFGGVSAAMPAILQALTETARPGLLGALEGGMQPIPGTPVAGPVRPTTPPTSTPQTSGVPDWLNPSIALRSEPSPQRPPSGVSEPTPAASTSYRAESTTQPPSDYRAEPTPPPTIAAADRERSRPPEQTPVTDKASVAPAAAPRTPRQATTGSRPAEQARGASAGTGRPPTRTSTPGSRKSCLTGCIASVLLVGLAVTGLIVAALIWGEDTTSDQAPTPTLQAARPSATPTRAAVASPALPSAVAPAPAGKVTGAVRAIATPAPAAARRTVRDNFDDPTVGVMPTGTAGAGFSLSYEHQQYYMAIDDQAPADALGRVAVPGRFRSVAMTVKARLVGDATPQIVLGCNDSKLNGGAGYSVVVSLEPGKARYRLSRWDGGNETALTTWQTNTRLRDDNQTNEFSLSCRNGIIRFAVNGVTARSLVDRAHTSGVAWIGLSRTNGVKAVAAFDDLEVDGEAETS